MNANKIYAGIGALALIGGPSRVRRKLWWFVHSGK
jgi:hypothetical protein